MKVGMVACNILQRKLDQLLKEMSAAYLASEQIRNSGTKYSSQLGHQPA